MATRKSLVENKITYATLEKAVEDIGYHACLCNKQGFKGLIIASERNGKEYYGKSFGFIKKNRGWIACFWGGIAYRIEESMLVKFAEDFLAQPRTHVNPNQELVESYSMIKITNARLKWE